MNYVCEHILKSLRTTRKPIAINTCVPIVRYDETLLSYSISLNHNNHTPQTFITIVNRRLCEHKSNLHLRNP